MKTWGSLIVGQLVCLTGLAACTVSDPGDGISGELGVGTFDYQCVIASDAACISDGVVDAFLAKNDLGGQKEPPQAVAVGARFGLNYAGTLITEGPADGLEGISLIATEAAAPIDEIGTEAFEINEPTTTAFVALSAERRVVDFINMTAASPAELLVWENQASVESLKIEQGEKITLAFTLADESGRLLAGAVESSWQVGDASVLSLSDAQGDRSTDESELKNRVEIQVTGKNVGETQLEVQALDLSRSLNIEVLP